MLGQKITLRHLLRSKKRKLFLKQLVGKNINKKIYRGRLFLISLIFFLTCSIVLLFLSSINYYMKIIIIYSITGFLTFFMAYFGWISAKFLMDKINDNKQINVSNLLNYFKKLKKFIINKN